MYLGYIGMLISDFCYEGTILQGNFRNGYFSNNSFSKLPGKKFGNHNMTILHPNPYYNEVWDCTEFHVFVFFSLNST